MSYRLKHLKKASEQLRKQRDEADTRRLEMIKKYNDRINSIDNEIDKIEMGEG